MEVILLEKIRNLGDIGDKVAVKPGYARNFLLPQGKATTATAENIAIFEKRRAELEQKAAETLTAAQQRAKNLQKLIVNIPMKVAEEGKLFGSAGVREIVMAIQAAGGEVDKNEVILPEGPMRQIGEYEVNLQLHSDVVIAIKVSVVAEE